MISYLTSAISVPRSEAKADVDEAKRQASESAKVIHAARERQIQQIAEVTGQLQKENAAFDVEARHAQAQGAGAVQQKREQLAKLAHGIAQVKGKLRDKESGNERMFRHQFKAIRELRTQLEHAREVENQRQSDLMTIRKDCAAVLRRISARKNEAASLKRHLAMVEKDNTEIQAEIVKLEAQMSPTVFRTGNA